MPLQKLQFIPGVQHDGSRYSSSGSWSEADKVRFRAGAPEKIGGWQQAVLQQFLGTCRHLFPFSDLTGNFYLGIGTSFKYYIERGGSMYDITPIRKTVTPSSTPPLSNPFTTMAAARLETKQSFRLTRAPTARYTPMAGALEHGAGFCPVAASHSPEP